MREDRTYLFKVATYFRNRVRSINTAIHRMKTFRIPGWIISGEVTESVSPSRIRMREQMQLLEESIIYDLESLKQLSIQFHELPHTTEDEAANKFPKIMQKRRKLRSLRGLDTALRLWHTGASLGNSSPDES